MPPGEPAPGLGGGPAGGDRGQPDAALLPGESAGAGGDEPPRLSAEILLIFAIIAFASVDMTIAIPSLFPYIDELGGSSLTYGVAGAATNAAQIVSLPFFGWLADRASKRLVLLIGHVLMALGGLLYGAAASLPHGAPAVGAVIAARLLVGLAAGAGRGTAQAYITTRSHPARRTENLGLAKVITALGQMCGPVTNLLIVSLPRGRFTFSGCEIIFSQYTWVGYFIALTGVLYVILILLVLKPDPPSSSAARDKEAVSMGEARRQLAQTRMWIRWHIGFANNWILAVSQYFLPFFCLQQFGFDQVRVSLIFSVYGAGAFCGSFGASRCSRRYWERTLFTLFQLANTITIGVMAAYFCFSPGAAEESGSLGDVGDLMDAEGHDGAAIVALCMVVFAQAVTQTGMCESAAQLPPRLCSYFRLARALRAAPPNQGTLTYLIGKRGQGFYQSIFLVFTALGRAAGAQWCGFALHTLTTKQLWLVAVATFYSQWLPFLWNYHGYHPHFMKLLNGENAMLGPSGSSTSSRNPPSAAECAAVEAAFGRARAIN